MNLAIMFIESQKFNRRDIYLNPLMKIEYSIEL